MLQGQRPRRRERCELQGKTWAWATPTTMSLRPGIHTPPSPPTQWTVLENQPIRALLRVLSCGPFQMWREPQYPSPCSQGT